MWCSGKSVQEYSCFGDVVTFDTTYYTNFYKMPFGLFVGVNNHFQTTIFARVLMKSETIESFKWVFTEFLKLMKGAPPQTVLTDQCKAMTIALAEVWSETFHLWCKWHVFKNIREHLGPTYTKNLAFRDELYSIANEMLTKEEFELAWQDLCVRYKLTDNSFMIRMFQCRSKWAKPWSKGNFCGGMTSMQRSESANMMLKKFVPRNSLLHHFVSQYNMLLHDREMEEGRAEDQTKQAGDEHRAMDEEFRRIKEGPAERRWGEREATAYWKGNPDVASPLREALLGCNDTARWRAEIMRQNWTEEARSGYSHSRLSAQCTHRYKIYAEGFAWSVSLKYILACGSMALLIEPRYQDFFSRSLEPRVNYWPVSGDAGMCESIRDAVDWGNTNPGEAERVGRRGQQLVQALRMRAVYDYMLHLLTEYARLMEFAPAETVPPSPDAQEACEASLLCLADDKQRRFLEASRAEPAVGEPYVLPPPRPAEVQHFRLD